MNRSSGKQRFFLVYDFSDDRKRTKCAKILEEYGIRVQYSVFEFELSKAKKKEMFARLKRRHLLDQLIGQNIIAIPVDGNTLEKVERFGEAEGFFDLAAILSI